MLMGMKILTSVSESHFCAQVLEVKLTLSVVLAWVWMGRASRSLQCLPPPNAESPRLSPPSSKVRHHKCDHFQCEGFTQTVVLHFCVERTAVSSLKQDECDFCFISILLSSWSGSTASCQYYHFH